MTTKNRAKSPDFGAYPERTGNNVWIGVKWKRPNKNGAQTKAEVCMAIPFGNGWRRYRMSVSCARETIRGLKRAIDRVLDQNSLGH